MSKQEQAINNEIARQIRDRYGLECEMIADLRRYINLRNSELGYGYAMDGNLLIFTGDVRSLFEHHYKTAKRMSDAHLWDVYCRWVGRVIKSIVDKAGER